MVHLSFLFSMFLTHSFLPTELIQTTLVPLLKNKTGNISDVNNYRAIALSNSISKLLEDVLLQSIKKYDTFDDMHQFGFKKQHSTVMGCSVLKRVIDYYRNNGSYVFACFLDLSKAFDRVNHKTLFTKLAKLNIPGNLLKLLMFWYDNQLVNVKWKTIISDSFKMRNGTRQGSVLSPYLFSIYIREVSSHAIDSGIGCFVGSLCCNIILYADDMVLLAPSWKALQNLINTCDACTKNLDMKFNASKSVTMIFSPYKAMRRVDYAFPLFSINGENLENVNVFKYLGHLISNDLSDNNDIVRQMGLLYGRSNFLCRKFMKCSRAVKLCLFKAYCLSFYCMALWDNFHNAVICRIKAAYIKCIKKFFGFKRMDSVTGMFAELRLPTFNTLLHNAKVKLLHACQHHPNKLFRMVHVLCV